MLNFIFFSKNWNFCESVKKGREKIIKYKKLIKNKKLLKKSELI
jgi:hypothetical protein